MIDEQGHIWVTREEGILNLLTQSRFSPRTERIPLSQAAGRICAENVFALHNLPNLIASRWDGIAVRFADFENGMPDTETWEEGREYLFANTGIGIKGDYDTTIRIEDVTFDRAGRLSLATMPACRGDLTVPVGAMLEKGRMLISEGTMIAPDIAAHIASGGHATVLVYARPKVSFIPTGNELVPAGLELGPGENVETNSIMIEGKLRAWGAEPHVFGIVEDDPEKLTEALRTALDEADIVILNGGSSKGTDDHACTAIGAVARIMSHAVLMGPGAHTSIAITDAGTPIIGLSGPTGGAECTSDWYVKPLVDQYLGQPYRNPPTVKARLSADVLGRPAGTSSVSMALRMHVSLAEDHVFEATPLSTIPKDDRRSTSGGNGFVFAPCGAHYHKGESVEVELRYPYLMPEKTLA